MTEEEISKLYERVTQCCISKHGIDPSEIIIEDGYFQCVKITYGCCDDPDERYCYSIYAKDLSSDLDALVEERKKKEQEEAIKAKEAERLRRENYERIAKEQRKKKYLKLKEEFDGGSK